MATFKFLIILLVSSTVYAVDNDIEKITQLFIPSSSQNNKSKIKTSACKIQEAKWLGILIMREGFAESLKFNKECDLQGNFTVEYNKTFPIKLKVKDQKILKNITGNIHLNIEFGKRTELVIDLKKIILKELKKTFSYTHKFELDPFSTPPLKSDLGGVLIMHSDKNKVIKVAPKSGPLKF